MKITRTNKSNNKLFRTILQSTILICVIGLTIKILFYPVEYKSLDTKICDILSETDKGFIALSYVAVDREGNSSMISKTRLDEHLQALKNNGYVSITQQNIMDYYKKESSLPINSMFLMFEDGRRDTAILSNELMQKYNFKGTMLTYAEHFYTNDVKFLQPDDLRDLVKNSYWEIGTNGYRLSYINVFDKYDRSLGELSPIEFVALRSYLGRKYDHYLMDYIRDENDIPKETYDQMVSRINADYLLMKDHYEKEFGIIPYAYVLMHSNTGRFGSNNKTSLVNEKWIKELFEMNFNREGRSINNRKNDIYDLTRMQPQAYWYPNHLLMRIRHDTMDHIKFEEGDIERKNEWETLQGVAEFRKSVIALTSEPEGSGRIRLKNSDKFNNINVSVRLTGNKLGVQTVYLRADEELKNFVSVQLKNNFLYIIENDEIIFELDLNEHDNITPLTIDEDMKKSLLAEQNVYDESVKVWGEVTTKMTQPKSESKVGSKEYVAPVIQINEEGNRLVNITLIEDKITVHIDNKMAAGQLTIKTLANGSVLLESAWGEYGYSQRNIADDVYDGVFDNLIIKDGLNDTILYDNQLKGFEKFKLTLNEIWDTIINWVIRNL